ncbi:hypothetical protein PIB30_043436, partial [Stylosanthes scabra]|nr:hypothetical protein [Stylosanthes scabra]
VLPLEESPVARTLLGTLGSHPLVISPAQDIILKTMLTRIGGSRIPWVTRSSSLTDSTISCMRATAYLHLFARGASSQGVVRQTDRVRSVPELPVRIHESASHTLRSFVSSPEGLAEAISMIASRHGNRIGIEIDELTFFLMIVFYINSFPLLVIESRKWIRQELRSQPGELVEGEFVHPSALSWGTLALFMKEEDDGMRLCVNSSNWSCSFLTCESSDSMGTSLQWFSQMRVTHSSILGQEGGGVSINQTKKEVLLGRKLQVSLDFKTSVQRAQADDQKFQEMVKYIGKDNKKELRYD